MRKYVEKASLEEGLISPSLAYLDLDVLARVEISSEAADFPIEGALIESGFDEAVGWRAAEPGPQTLRLRFDQPQDISAVDLLFVAEGDARTQEFVLRWSQDDGLTYHDLARQQYNFSPPNTVREAEHYAVNLQRIDVLELTIIPDISGGSTLAALKELRLS